MYGGSRYLDICGLFRGGARVCRGCQICSFDRAGRSRQKHARRALRVCLGVATALRQCDGRGVKSLCMFSSWWEERERSLDAPFRATVWLRE